MTVLQNKFWLFISFFLLTAQLVSAGGWPQGKKKAYFQLSNRWMISDSHYTDKGLTDPNVTTGLSVASFYGEYGISNKLTVTAYLPFLVTNFQNNIVSGTRNVTIQEGQAIYSPGDIILGADYLLAKGNFLSLTAGAGIGIATGTVGTGDKENLQTGDGENNVLLRSALGVSIFNNEKISLYSKIGGYFNKRTKDFSDEVQSQVEFGAFYNKKYFIIQKIINVTSLQNGVKSGEQISSAGVFANNAEFTAYEIRLGAEVFKGYSAFFGLNHILSGKIVAAGTSYEIGIFKNFQF